MPLSAAIVAAPLRRMVSGLTKNSGDVFQHAVLGLPVWDSGLRRGQPCPSIVDDTDL